MKLPKLAVAYHQFTLTAAFLGLLLGLVSFFTMPRSEDPALEMPGVTTVVIYPGAGAKQLERTVVDPLEEAINELEGIKELRSWAREGVAIVEVEFFIGNDPDKSYDDVLRKVGEIKGTFPGGVRSVESVQWTPQDVNFLQVALVSETASYHELERLADRLEKSLERVGGVKKAEKWAYPERQVRITPDLARLAARGVSVQELGAAVAGDNADIPGGTLEMGPNRFQIKTSGAYRSLEEMERTIVRSDGRGIVRLGELATVAWAYDDEDYRARVQGKRALFVTAKQKARTNIFRVQEGADRILAAFEKELPAGITLETVYRQSDDVDHRVGGFMENLLQGILLIGAVVLLAVGVRPAVVVMTAVPLSLFIGIGLVDMAGFGLQQISIAGLVIALGLLVDNAIVVVENTQRFMLRGHAPKEAAVAGAAQVAWPVVSATATTMLAFVPMIAMNSLTGEFVRSMPVTVVTTLAASLLIALTFTPWLSGVLLKAKKKRSRPALLERLVEGPYAATLAFALKRRLLTMLLATGALAGSLALFPYVGVSFFPNAEKPQFLIDVNLPEGSGLDETDKAVRFVEGLLADEEGVATYAANVGHGNPKVYYNVQPKDIDAAHGQIFVQMKAWEPENFYALFQRIREKAADYPGARIEVREFKQGPPMDAPIAFKLIGDDLEKLEGAAARVQEIVETVPGTLNVTNPLETAKTDLQVKIFREKAGLLGVRPEAVDRAVRGAVAGWPVSMYRDEEGEEHPIVLRMPFEGRPTLSRLEELYVPSATGAQVPLLQVAEITFAASPARIFHFMTERTVTVTADTAPGVSVEGATQAALAAVEEAGLPEGIRLYVGGEKKNREDSFGGMAQTVLAAMIGIFAVLVLQFRSFRQPLVVFAAIPLAVIGAVLGLFLTGYSFSFMAFVGITSLVGIVVNNAIILVDYANTLRREGQKRDDALLEAGKTRFTPILLTTVTTIGGLLPLTLTGGTLWAPMGWVIIGGLAVSAFLTLIVVPVLYSLLEPQTFPKENQ